LFGWTRQQRVSVFDRLEQLTARVLRQQFNPAESAGDFGHQADMKDGIGW